MVARVHAQGPRHPAIAAEGARAALELLNKEVVAKWAQVIPVLTPEPESAEDVTTVTSTEGAEDVIFVGPVRDVSMADEAKPEAVQARKLAAMGAVCKSGAMGPVRSNVYAS